ncbi:hypothetical protein R69888_00462 [Paraburkholderia haematera]|uniref:Uncharacterized protein n=1 Tax=Paraburkholderia haematera TaxID=2793077 RepID=A0ABM8QGH5_9BURK|nr:hypothetical protein R69888_00462 [Paraburkholderia haematera]
MSRCRDSLNFELCSLKPELAAHIRARRRRTLSRKNNDLRSKSLSCSIARAVRTRTFSDCAWSRKLRGQRSFQGKPPEADHIPQSCSGNSKNMMRAAAVMLALSASSVSNLTSQFSSFINKPTRNNADASPPRCLSAGLHRGLRMSITRSTPGNTSTAGLNVSDHDCRHRSPRANRPARVLRPRADYSDGITLGNTK